MPLSRNCYSLEEVQSALGYAGSRSLPHETVFWCKELVESGCAGEAISVLFESWLWHRGPFQIQWFLETWPVLSSPEVSLTDILQCAHRLSSGYVKDHSLWHILSRTATHFSSLFDRVTHRSPPQFPSEDAIEVFFIRALYQRKAQSAWWAAHYLSSHRRCWELMEWYLATVLSVSCPIERKSLVTFMDTIQQYDALLGYRTDEYDKAIQCSVILLLCLPASHRKKSLQAMSCISSISGISNKSRRAYSIPRECLYGTTRRGLYPRGTRWELYDVEKRVQGCPFWDETLVPYTTDGKWQSEEAMEIWYATHFPEDIPDEWSAAEKEKSHGPSVLGPEETPNLGVYSRRMFGSLARFVWTRHEVERALEGISLTDTPFTALLSLSGVIPPLEKGMLDPVHKRVVYRGG